MHAEYQSKLRDPARLVLSDQTGVESQASIHDFGAGNLDTLNKPGLLEALRKFYKNQYSANRMALVVLGKNHSMI